MKGDKGDRGLQGASGKIIISLMSVWNENDCSRMKSIRVD